MKIRFAEHITESHREGILDEIAWMGASAERLDEDSYLITAARAAWYASAAELLRQEERAGRLELDESFTK